MRFLISNDTLALQCGIGYAMSLYLVMVYFVLTSTENMKEQCSKTQKVSRQDSEICNDLAHDYPNKGLFLHRSRSILHALDTDFQVSVMKFTIRTMTLTMIILMATDKS